MQKQGFIISLKTDKMQTFINKGVRLRLMN